MRCPALRSTDTHEPPARCRLREQKRHLATSLAMAVAENAPQPFWTVGVDHDEVDDNAMLREAKKQVVIEIMTVKSFVPPYITRPGIIPEDMKRRALDPDYVCKSFATKLSSCDRAFITSRKPWTVPVGRHAAELASKFDGSPMLRSSYFELACMSYRPPIESKAEFDPIEHSDLDPNFDDFLQSISGKSVEADAYGSGSCALELAVCTMSEFAQAKDLTNQLVQRVKTEMSDHPSENDDNPRGPFIANIEEANAVVERLVQNDEAHAMVVDRYACLKRARAGMVNFVQLLLHHYAQRRSKPPPLQSMEDDCFEVVSRHLDTKAAAALCCVSKSYRKSRPLGLRIPHLHIRTVQGSFPHVVTNSLDRDALSMNIKQVVTRNFVVKKKKIMLWVDFVQSTLRSRPLERGEVGSMPQLRAGRPTIEKHDMATAEGARMHRIETKRQKKWDDAEGPEECANELVYNHRVPYEDYFAVPLDISVSLVFADTLEPVSTPDLKDGIEPSRRYVMDGNSFRKPKDTGPLREMPAHCKLHVPFLTSEHRGRRFRLKLTGRGATKTRGQPVALVSYSETFEVVSDLGTVGRAGKRRTAAESSQFARERELKKRRTEAPPLETVE